MATRQHATSLDLISNITVLTSKRNHEEALCILQRVARMVRPVMKAHGWKIHTLAEFYPKHLLGMNTNRGYKIQLCLRSHMDETTFLPWDDILGTMLHELTHNIRGPHDELFYKALDNLNDEYDRLVLDTGYVGKGLDAVGHRLGGPSGRNAPMTSQVDWGVGIPLGSNRLVTNGTRFADQEVRNAVVLAAEKRRRVNELMLPAGGRSLGGNDRTGCRSLGGGTSRSECFSWEDWHTPREMAVLAAERRARDQVWCGLSLSTQDPCNPPDTLETVAAVSRPEQGHSTTKGVVEAMDETNGRPNLEANQSGQNIRSNGNACSSSNGSKRGHDRDHRGKDNSNHGKEMPLSLWDNTDLRPSRRQRLGSVIDLTQEEGKEEEEEKEGGKCQKLQWEGKQERHGHEHETREPLDPRTACTSSASSSFWSLWTCPTCTLVNQPLALQCECCLTVRP